MFFFLTFKSCTHATLLKFGILVDKDLKPNPNTNPLLIFSERTGRKKKRTRDTTRDTTKNLNSSTNKLLGQVHVCFSLSKWTQAPNVTGCPTLLMKNNRSPCQKPARCSNFKTCFSCTSSVPLTGQSEKAKALPRCNAPQVQHSLVLPCGARRPGPVAPTATGLRSTEH